ncbi:MAG: hypothetical protein IKY48_01555 [Bacteroidales bacterium]|nr:hypothetical protein [Bacteroidales bacterium]
MDRNYYIEEVAKVLKPVIKNDVEAGQNRSFNQYLDRALEVVKNRYKGQNNMGSFGFWTGHNKREIVMLWEEITPQVLAMIEGWLRDFRSKKMMKEIKVASAQALVKEAMTEAGLKYKFEGQTYRAKISVLLAPGRALTVYIAYSKLTAQLPGVVESLKTILKEMENLGKNVSINKVYWA